MRHHIVRFPPSKTRSITKVVVLMSLVVKMGPLHGGQIMSLPKGQLGSRENEKKITREQAE